MLRRAARRVKYPDEHRARKEAVMRSIVLFLWLAGFVQIAIAAALF